MPRGERRPARAKRLIQHYVNAKKAWEKCLQRRKAAFRKAFQHAREAIGHVDSPASLSSLSDMSTGSDSGPDAGNWESLDGWLALHDTPQTSLHESVRFNNTELPELLSLGSGRFSESDEESSHNGDNFDSDLLNFDADDEFSDYGSTEDEDDGEPVNLDKWARLRKWVLGQLSDMYAQRYVSIPFKHTITTFSY